MAESARARDALVSRPGPLSHGRPWCASAGTPAQPSLTSVASTIVRSGKNVNAVFFRGYGRRPQVKHELAACHRIDYTAGLGGGFSPSPQRLPRFAGGIARSRFCCREFVMPSNPPYIPPKDADLAAWLANFSSLLTASPTTYGQSSAVAVAVAAANSAYQAAYTLVTSPSTKTANTVAAKNTAKTFDSRGRPSDCAADFSCRGRPYERQDRGRREPSHLRADADHSADHGSCAYSPRRGPAAGYRVLSRFRRFNFCQIQALRRAVCELVLRNVYYADHGSSALGQSYPTYEISVHDHLPRLGWWSASLYLGAVCPQKRQTVLFFAGFVLDRATCVLMATLVNCWDWPATLAGRSRRSFP